AYFAPSAAGAKETTSTRGSAYLLGSPHRRAGLLTERAQESTPASAPQAPGRLGREDARSFGVVTSQGAILPAVALILRESDVQDLIEMDEVIAALEAAMRELGEGEAQNEPRRRAFAPGGLLNVMFASYPGGKCTGLKAYTVSNGRVRFLVAMFGLDGALEALIEADFMGAYRTGAATAVAAKALRVPGEATVALIGTGWQAATQALALSRVLEIKELRVFSRNADRRATFAAEQEEQLGVATVVAGGWERPERPGITLFESHGLALWDLAAASVVVAAARRRGSFEEIELL